MWVLRKNFRFEAAHHLPHHGGKCFQVHGHSWVGQVEVAGDSLHTAGGATGMLMDYMDITLALLPLIEGHLDHKDLNVSTGLESPTSENIARYVYDWLAPRLSGLVAVTIRETCTCECRYQP